MVSEAVKQQGRALKQEYDRKAKALRDEINGWWFHFSKEELALVGKIDGRQVTSCWSNPLLPLQAAQPGLLLFNGEQWFMNNPHKKGDLSLRLLTGIKTVRTAKATALPIWIHTGISDKYTRGVA